MFIVVIVLKNMERYNYGPFMTQNIARAWAHNHLTHYDYSVVRLYSPEKSQ